MSLTILFFCCFLFFAKTDFRPDQAVTIIRTFLLPHWLGGQVTTGFTSSGSLNCDLAERNRRSRAPLTRRLFVNGWNGGVLGHFLYMIFAMAAIATSLGQTFSILTRNSSSQERARWIFILTHAGWPPLSWIWMTCLSAFAIPILNIFRPPSIPDREKLLVRFQDTGVAYPKKGADAERLPQWSTTDYVQELMYSLVTIYTTALFVASWVK